MKNTTKIKFFNFSFFNLRNIVLALLYLSFCNLSNSQVIENVDYNFVDDVIKIYYDIKESKTANEYEVEIKFVNDKGETVIPRTVRGDVGRVTGGKNKNIEWSIFEDRQNLEGNYKAVVEIVKIYGKGNYLCYDFKTPVSYLGLKYSYTSDKFGFFLNVFGSKISDPTEKMEIHTYGGPTFRILNSLTAYAGYGLNLYDSRDRIMGAGTLIKPFKDTNLLLDVGLGYYKYTHSDPDGYSEPTYNEKIYLNLGLGLIF